MSYLSRPKRGFVLGKFMPPHTGHLYLCDFARASVEDLTILVCSLPSDPIPGAQRVDWMRELAPWANVRHCEEIAPQAPEDDPQDFWRIWRDLARRHHPEPIDVVFASELYGHRLAAELGARFAPVDIGRTAHPVSASAIRADPYANWRFIPPVVRPYYLKRVTLFGTESSGKTTLANALARHFETIVAPEYGRFYTEAFGAQCQAEDIRRIVQGHLAGRSAASRLANRVLIEDTDPVLTAVWSDALTGGRDPWFAAYRSYPDLYLLCEADIPWVNDGTRYFANPADRQRFQMVCERELEARGAPFIRIRGTQSERLTAAIRAIEPLLALGG